MFYSWKENFKFISLLGSSLALYVKLRQLSPFPSIKLFQQFIPTKISNETLHQGKAFSPSRFNLSKKYFSLEILKFKISNYHISTPSSTLFAFLSRIMHASWVMKNCQREHLAYWERFTHEDKRESENCLNGSF